VGIEYSLISQRLEEKQAFDESVTHCFKNTARSETK
jgi:hypothetical protein